MAWRASLLQATWNYERQQGVGWAFALAPALDRLIPDVSARTRRLAEHTAYFNTQPTLASIALGAVARLEEQRARGETQDPSLVPRVKSMLGSSLAALGDRLFWFTLRPFAACIGLILVLLDRHWGALAMWVVYNAGHQGVRWAGVGWGFAQGPAAATGPLRRRLDDAIVVLGRAGSMLVGIVLACLMVRSAGAGDGPLGPVSGGTGTQLLLAGGLALGLITAHRPRPSPAEWALGIGVVVIAIAWFAPTGRPW